MGEEKRVEPTYLLDATAMIFRGYYGSKPMEASDGTPSNAVFGFTQIMLKFLRERTPKHLALAFDAGAKSFRNDIYPDYKANRGAPPPDLAPQFDLCIDVTKALGLPYAMVKGYEADDILGTLARACEAAGQKVIIVSVDKDLAQLVTENISLMDPSKLTITDQEGVYRRFGVGADQVPDWLALVGDSSDNIPGVPGVGMKSASALLEVFPKLEDLFENLDNLDQVKIRGRAGMAVKLAEGKETAFLARRLATIDKQIPLDLGMDDLNYGGPQAGAYEALFEHLGFGWVARRVTALKY